MYYSLCVNNSPKRFKWLSSFAPDSSERASADVQSGEPGGLQEGCHLESNQRIAGEAELREAPSAGEHLRFESVYHVVGEIEFPQRRQRPQEAGWQSRQTIPRQIQSRQCWHSVEGSIDYGRETAVRALELVDAENQIKPTIS